MNRRKFLHIIGLVFPLFAIWGCGGSEAKTDAVTDPGGGSGELGGDQDDPNEPTPSCAGDATVTYTNPGHAHTPSPLTQAELDAAVPGDYSLLLGGDHTHMIEITDQDFRDLKNGKTVVKMDSDRHGHEIVIAC